MSDSTERKKFNRFTFNLPLIVKPHVHRLSFSKWRKSNILAKVIQLRALHSSHTPPGTNSSPSSPRSSRDIMGCDRMCVGSHHQTFLTGHTALKRSLIRDLAHWLRMRLPLSCRTTSLSNKYQRNTSTSSSLIFPIMTRDDGALPFILWEISEKGQSWI